MSTTDGAWLGILACWILIAFVYARADWRRHKREIEKMLDGPGKRWNPDRRRYYDTHIN